MPKIRIISLLITLWPVWICICFSTVILYVLYYQHSVKTFHYCNYLSVTSCKLIMDNKYNKFYIQRNNMLCKHCSFVFIQPRILYCTYTKWIHAKIFETQVFYLIQVWSMIFFSLIIMNAVDINNNSFTFIIYFKIIQTLRSVWIFT